MGVTKGTRELPKENGEAEYRSQESLRFFGEATKVSARSEDTTFLIAQQIKDLEPQVAEEEREAQAARERQAANLYGDEAYPG